MPRRVLLALGVLAALAACTGPAPAPVPRASIASPTPLPSISPPPAGTAAQPLDAATVRIHNHAYLPATVYVRQGGTVDWTNDDADPHSATPRHGAAFTATGRLGRDEDSGKVTFNQPGEQDYGCDYHPDETGKVVVVAPGASPSP